MPCSDLIIEEEIQQARIDKISKLENKIDFLEAALCGAMKIVEKSGKEIDYNSAGINKQELKRWWYNHKRKDARKRKSMKQNLT